MGDAPSISTWQRAARPRGPGYQSLLDQRGEDHLADDHLADDHRAEVQLLDDQFASLHRAEVQRAEDHCGYGVAVGFQPSSIQHCAE